MELPLDTLLITSEQAKEVINKKLPLLFYYNYQRIKSNTQNWSRCTPDSLNAFQALQNNAEFAMQEHDYFHYFGEIIDLDTKILYKGINKNRTYMCYMEHILHIFSTTKDGYVIIKEGGTEPIYSHNFDIDDMKKFVTKYYQDIFDKHKPNDNIIFIWK